MRRSKHEDKKCNDIYGVGNHAFFHKEPQECIFSENTVPIRDNLELVNIESFVWSHLL